MTTYVLLLRGVNVGGVNLKMTDVAAALTDAGFTAVRTVLASGNILVDSEHDRATVTETAQQRLRERFDYPAWVLVYELAAVRAIAADYPFTPEVDGYHSYVTFVADPAALEELAGLAAGADEKIARGDGVVYWQVPKNTTLKSALGATMGAARYKPVTTTRNLRTLGKVLARAQ
ncbi:DUF1697 domain-containing protein [Mycolicibacillus koreensis]|uniref:Pyridoxamine 5-phosphate oxidase n=1 Tax=Mycolicibacillus koreensis TaxID=1069220 RepID=A0AA91SR93_9MYCO|nr:DUF1697 domain-containing protein [Mycolicibacillus koreensis]ODR07849.1 pyridoxamine 5-phosphate oxidase [Mycolicibacillus koreensis]OSC33000.1 pyridoxamine 5-phosphate oxidase [Mycolicibacillus koreensis]